MHTELRTATCVGPAAHPQDIHHLQDFQRVIPWTWSIPLVAAQQNVGFFYKHACAVAQLFRPFGLNA